MAGAAAARGRWPPRGWTNEGSDAVGAYVGAVMSKTLDVAIVGAGPYGLSLASHLRAAGVAYRIFGTPMRFWREHVPRGTCLKSDGESSDLIDPAGALRLPSYTMERDRAFSRIKPVAVERFVEYGETFQRRLVPELDRRDIAGVSRSGALYRLTTDDGEVVLARRVVLAVGINAFRFMPELFSHLPASLLSHTAVFGDVTRLAGRKVAVIGSGASAIDVAAAAHEAGAEVTIISRRERIEFHAPPGRRKLHHKIRHPDTGIGAGWSQSFYVHGPDAFRFLPARLRLSIVGSALGPSPGWFMRERIIGRVPILSSKTVARATVEANRVRLDLGDSAFVADHVVAATGYRIDMNRLEFLDPALRSDIRVVQGAPVLSSDFRTSVPGLYVIGPASAFSFGPVMRFVYGARFATPRVAARLIGASRIDAGVAKTSATRELASVR